ncbi:DUF7125 family protein [Halorhabdus rudnickae]|uniref:DUF7125 family protein n=1 Tax=Halorhabdus rudnickae TaxID=1775544 RepID=UPI00108486F2|nr:P-loop NTPase [Halorhabdus rudnickae]
MIAIAGAKGGCGKTTVTLGLAKALADSGRPTIAVDADRQLPDLHTTADVDREPTIAALDGQTDVASVAKGVPGVPGVGVITAQRSGETVDQAAVLERLDYETADVLVDCPSGVGPDVVEPLAAADHAVVVTTGTERSLEAARTTIDAADRLDISIAGVVFNRCETVPDELAAELDAETLGAVPDRDSPLVDDAIEAFQEVAKDLRGVTGSATADTGVPQRPDRLPTGVVGLDRLLGGGVPCGGVVALEAPPASQAELLLYNLTATRGTLYLTSERSEATVRNALASSPVEVGNPTIRELDSDAPLGTATELIENLPEGANLVVDAVDPLETIGRRDYVDFLNVLAERVADTAGLAVLHCLETPSATDGRGVTEQFADVVVEFCPERDGVDPGLELRKFRSERSPDRYESLSLSEAVPIERPTSDSPTRTQEGD